MSQIKPNVLLVDDQPFYARPFIDELSAGFLVKYCKSAQTAVEFGKTFQSRFTLVLDIMMPPPSRALVEDTDNGLSTGVWVLRELAPTLKETKSPTLLLTNLVNPQVIKNVLEDPEFSGIRVELMRKPAATPGALLNKVSSMQNI